MAHKDKYCNFKDLAKYENEKVDYRIVLEDRESSTTVLAPHGGGIEPLTSLIARAIAGNDYNLYCFEGLKRNCNYETLHITSHHFDEPQCLDLLLKSHFVIAIHGTGKGDERIFVGGRNSSLKSSIAHQLRHAGFNIQMNNHPYPGRDQMNICNRGATSEGVQLELTKELRKNMDVRHFAKVVRKAIAHEQAV